MLSLDVVSDVICPWCFIGKRRLEAALTDIDEVDMIGLAWRPFQLNPTMPPQGMDRGSYLAAKFGTAERAADTYAHVSAVGETVGIAFQFHRIRRTPNTLAAHRLIRFAQRLRRQDPVVEALFAAYFLDGRDVGSVEVLSEVATDAGLDGGAVKAYLSSPEDVDAVLADDDRARRMGVTGVPCFIIARTYALAGAQEPDLLRGAIIEAARRTAVETTSEVRH
ncbi:MAG: DsbA family oxidoreductase [Alphaproteobacteria bacterium]|nr:DsbA family oxidoreductase [Alphaproteobacteria bacterium]TAD89793.1 MAG: DsbA family oxidoreductase [Alphaproteobacteria bacterium]